MVTTVWDTEGKSLVCQQNPSLWTGSLCGKAPVAHQGPLSIGKEGVKRFPNSGHTIKQKLDPAAAPLPLPQAALQPCPFSTERSSLSLPLSGRLAFTQVPLSPTVSLPHLCDVKQSFCFLFKTLAPGAIIGKKGSWGPFIWKNPFKSSWLSSEWWACSPDVLCRGYVGSALLSPSPKIQPTHHCQSVPITRANFNFLNSHPPPPFTGMLLG